MADHAESLVITRLEDRGETGHVAHLTVNNPEKRNALGARGKDELIAALTPRGTSESSGLLLTRTSFKPILGATRSLATRKDVPRMAMRLIGEH
jgi:1,4-dihydroxy-2-naphthoyl-CoA synthase